MGLVCDRAGFSQLSLLSPDHQIPTTAIRSSPRTAYTINSIETFWSYPKRRHQMVGGLHRSSFPAYLTESEICFRFLDKGPHKILLKSNR